MPQVKMDSELKTKWIAKLRDPTTKKGVRRLEYPDGRQCCLGVLANLVGIPKRLGVDQRPNNKSTLLTAAFPVECYFFQFPGHVGGLSAMPPDDAFPGISAVHMGNLAQLNDFNSNFDAVVDYIEKYL